MIHTGVDDLGLEIDDIVFVQGVAQLQLLLGRLNKSDRTGRIIEIARDFWNWSLGRSNAH